VVDVIEEKHDHRVITETGAFRWGWSLAMIIFISLVLGVGGLFYTAHTARQTERHFEHNQQLYQQRWCDVLNAIDSPDAPPATTPRAIKIENEIRTLRLEFGCLKAR
jgi:hypothetical protein